MTWKLRRDCQLSSYVFLGQCFCRNTVASRSRVACATEHGSMGYLTMWHVTVLPECSATAPLAHGTLDRRLPLPCSVNAKVRQQPNRAVHKPSAELLAVVHTGARTSPFDLGAIHDVDDDISSVVVLLLDDCPATHIRALLVYFYLPALGLKNRIICTFCLYVLHNL